MLSQQDNEMICRVGPGTPMGSLMRQYWVPALLSEELPEPDCPPLRVMLLGEKLIAFRDSAGRVGLVADACPHRGASLFFGRNEEEGLRCVYHGWKFDVNGACVDMPSEPPESSFKNKVRITSYPTRERNGLVWAYMGPRGRDNLPPLPHLEANMQDDGNYVLYGNQIECNWLQVLEGDIDTVHLGFLHRGSFDPDNMPEGSTKFEYYALKVRHAYFKVVDIEAGSMYGAYREAEPGMDYWRIALFLFPFYTMAPGGGGGVFARVPMDDSHTMTFFMSPRNRSRFANLPEPSPERRRGAQTFPRTTDWYGRYRSTANMSNDFFIDREAQKRNQGSIGYTGIIGPLQDHAIVESMGPLYDRSQEHLGTTDAMVIRVRRRLLAAARALQDQGITPPGVDDPNAYLVRTGQALLPKGADWIEETKEMRRVPMEPPPLASV